MALKRRSQYGPILNKPIEPNVHQKPLQGNLISDCVPISQVFQPQPLRMKSFLLKRQKKLSKLSFIKLFL